jgi:hypothetical protein
MSAACNFIDMMSTYCCNTLNREELNLYFYKYEEYFYKSEEADPVYKIIEDNMMKGRYFSSKKFSEFLLDKSKLDDVKLALIELEEHGMQLKHCWEHTGISNEDLSRKEKVISYLIIIEDIYTFNDLFKAFEPNGLGLE